MPELFVDTSSLVKYYYPEEGSDDIEQRLLKARRVHISGLSIVETASALMKKVRQGELVKKDEMLIWNTFLDDLGTDSMEVVYLTARHYEKAADIIREFGATWGIKTLDALQLAVAHGIGNVKFLSSDTVLAGLAAEMGLKVVRSGQ